MEISKMRSRITIQKNTVEVDAIGNRKVVWTDFYSCYAYANIATGKTAGQEYEAAGQTVASDGYTFTVRYCKALKDMDSSLMVTSTTLPWWMISSSGIKR